MILLMTEDSPEKIILKNILPRHFWIASEIASNKCFWKSLTKRNNKYWAFWSSTNILHKKNSKNQA